MSMFVKFKFKYDFLYQNNFQSFNRNVIEQY